MSNQQQRPISFPNNRGGTLYIRFAPGSSSWKEIRELAEERYGRTTFGDLVIGVRVDGDMLPVIHIMSVSVAHNLLLPDATHSFQLIDQAVALFAQENRVTEDDVVLFPTRDRRLQFEISGPS